MTPDGLDRLRQDLSRPADPLPDGDVSIEEGLGPRLGPEAMAVLVDPLVGRDQRRLDGAARAWPRWPPSSTGPGATRTTRA